MSEIDIRNIDNRLFIYTNTKTNKRVKVFRDGQRFTKPMYVVHIVVDNLNDPFINDEVFEDMMVARVKAISLCK